MEYESGTDRTVYKCVGSLGGSAVYRYGNGSEWVSEYGDGFGSDIGD